LTIAALLSAFIAKAYVLAALILLPLLAVFAVWAWPTGDRAAPVSLPAGPGLALPSQYAAHNAPGWWALVFVLLVGGALFAALVFAYFYLWLGSRQWPPGGGVPAAPMPLLAAVLLALAWPVLAWAQRRLDEAR